MAIDAEVDVKKNGFHASKELYFYQGDNRGGMGACFNFGLDTGPVEKRVKVRLSRWGGSLIAMDDQMRGSIPHSKHAHGAGDQPCTTHGEHQIDTKQVLSAVIVFAHKKETINDPASVVNDSMKDWFSDQEKLKKEMQNVIDAAESDWLHFEVYRAIMERSKGYVSIAVTPIDDSETAVNLIINTNVRKGLLNNMNAVLTHTGQKNITSIDQDTISTRIESPLLACMVKDRDKVKGQMRIHYYPVNGGYMVMHTDSAGRDSWSFFKCSYMETDVGLQTQGNLPFSLQFEGDKMTVVDRSM